MGPLPEFEQPVPPPPTRLNLTPEQRVMAYHVIDNIDRFLSKDRWLKGGWFSTNGDAQDRGYHTECFANFIRRVEKGGQRLNGDFDGEDGEDGENFAGAYSITEGVVAQAIQEQFPGEERHMHFTKGRLESTYGLEVYVEDGHAGDHRLIEPENCTLLDGGRCGTCQAQRYSDEVTVVIMYGPFPGDDGESVIPRFNDNLGTRYADVQRVIDRSRELVTGVTVTSAADVMTEQERIDIELASIDAQTEIDSERLHGWMDELGSRGWVRKRLTEREIARRLKRIKQQAEKAKQVIREDCENCT